ncbi:MAG: glycosyltransferase, partial [Lautropia sp.]|nr:glycosyltransferase [Lautropia sp.]
FTGHAHDIFVHDHDLSAKLCQASFAVTISDYNRRKLSARMPLALRNQLHVIHCGIFADDIPFHTGNRKAGQIVAVGRLDPIKGFIHLIEACRLLNERGVDFQCDIIGDGPLRATLQQAIENARLNDRVRLTGALPQHEVRQRINEAAIFVLPSVQLADGNADGIPVALMEAMASGAAVISTRVSGIPELVENGITGMLVSPGNAAALAEAIGNLLPDEILRARLAGMAHQYILQAFDANLEADKLLKLIRANLPESRTPAESKPLPTPVGLQPEPAPPPLPNPLRIMIMTDEMEVGGSQRQIVQLASGLKARRIECTVVYFINPSFLLDELHAAGVETIRVDKRKPVDPVFLRQLRKTIRQWRPDVLHCFSFTAELWGAVALQTLPARQRPALISSVRGTYEWYSERQWKLKRWVSLRSQAIISNSLEGADYAARRMQLPLEDFSIVANGVRVLQPQAELVHQLRSKYLLSPVASGSDDMTQDDRGMLLLFVGRLVEHKNLPRLLDAFAPVAAENPHVSLLLVGSGPLGPSLKAQVQQHNLSHQVRMLGERDDVAALMSAADIVVAPSLREGLSNVILEAMALGRPVIATPVGATPDVIDDGVNGLLVDASDTHALSAAMRRLIGDADLRKRLGTAAHARVTEKYSPQVMVRSMLKEYQRVSQR